MSTISHIPTRSLKEGDLLLVGASMVHVKSLEPDSMDDGVYWLTGDCISGNFDQWVGPQRVTQDATWQVLDAEAR